MNRRYISVYKNNELNDILEDLLEETEKVIVVYYFKEDLRQLKSLKYKYTTDPYGIS